MINPQKYIEQQRAKNPFFPLPPDYSELPPEEQQKARIAAITKQDTALDVVVAWDCFRRLYLLTTPPGFFYHNFVPSPLFHYEAIYDVGAYARNVLAAPRGFAKSFIVGIELVLFLLLTRPYYRIVLSMATDKLIEARFDALMKQLTENEFILADFGVLKPKRGDAIWNRHHIQLTTGSKVEGFSITGRKRGARPDIFILDDPEYDPESDSEESALILKEKFETFLFHQVIPMLEKESAIFWIGTMIGRRSFLYHACSGDDSRFEFWNRKVLKSLVTTDPNHPTEVTALWDGKWDVETLSARRKEIGDSAFMAEYQNDPTSIEEKTLKIHREKNEYLVQDFESELHQRSPLISTCPVCYHLFNPTTRNWDLKKTPARDLYKQMFRVITFDPAKGLGPHNDYACIAVMGFDNENCLWVLDMWMGRAKESTLLNNIYRLGLLWQPRVVGIESISMQIQIVDSMKILLEERSATGWMPRVVPVDYTTRGGQRRKKADRIATLEWRFEAGKIKYPNHLSQRWPFLQLYNQTRDFTYDMALLRFDDAIDAIAMGHYIIHGRGAKDFPSVREPTLADKIRAGQLTSEGVPLISGINANEIDKDALQAIIDRRYISGYNGQDRGKPRSRKPYVVRRIRRPAHIIS